MIEFRKIPGKVRNHIAAMESNAQRHPWIYKFSFACYGAALGYAAKCAPYLLSGQGEQVYDIPRSLSTAVSAYLLGQFMTFTASFDRTEP